MNASRGDVRDGFADGHSGGRRRIKQRDGCSFSDGQRLTGKAVESGHRDAGICDGHLMRAHHLISGDQASHGPIANGYEKALVAHGWQSKNSIDGLLDIDCIRVELLRREGDLFDVSQHARGLPE